MVISYLTTIYCCFRSACTDPVAVLQEYHNNFMRGRQLDLESDLEAMESGDTYSLFVSRDNLLSDTMDELLRDDNPDFSVPLEITFNGEGAADDGGPRREYLDNMLRLFTEAYFTEAGDKSGYILEKPDDVRLRKKHYYAVGLMMGKNYLHLDHHRYEWIVSLLVKFLIIIRILGLIFALST